MSSYASPPSLEIDPPFHHNGIWNGSHSGRRTANKLYLHNISTVKTGAKLDAMFADRILMCPEYRLTSLFILSYPTTSLSRRILTTKSHAFAGRSVEAIRAGQFVCQSMPPSGLPSMVCYFVLRRIYHQLISALSDLLQRRGSLLNTPQENHHNRSVIDQLVSPPQ